jgi:PKD repeat protein
MKFPSKLTQTSTPLALLILLTAASILASSQTSTQPLATLNITAQTNQQKYYLREPVKIQGTLTDGGQPATDALIAMEIRDPRGDSFAYRTVPIGNPQQFWSVNITNVYITDQSNNPLTTAKINTVIKLSITVKSNLLNDITAIIAYTLYDNTLIPIRSSQWQLTITAQQTQTVTGQVYIPEWATPGKAIISANVYNKYPKNGGIPLTPEKTAYIYITRNEQQPEPYTPYTPKSYETQPGQYQIDIRMPPDRYTQPGTYNVYVVGMTSQTSISGTTTSFTMEDDPSPPQAAFTYYPPKLYANMTATFDASSSSAEGYNDTIIRYEWYFNDPNNPEHIIREGNYTNPPSPLAQHNFRYGGTYTVSLNVTDNEGLWSYTIKPVTVYPEYGPTANFTWTPYSQIVNRTVTFDASGSQPGWSAQIGDFSPIILYTWNFSDGTGKINATNPIITHNYTQIGNYTVSLTVTDSVGRTNTVSAQIEILNATYIYDVNGNGYVGGDDIVMVAKHFGTRPGDPNWDPRCDINGNGYVGGDDITAVAKHFGERYP